MTPPFGGGLFPVRADEAPAGVAAAWYNWAGRRIECDLIPWDAPDGRRQVVGMIVPCPKCAKPFISPSVPAGSYDVDSDGRLTLAVVLACGAYWPRARPDGSMVADAAGRPVMDRCGWVGAVRGGVAHHPRCLALHQPGCSGPRGGPQACGCRMSRLDGHADCNCGAVTR